MKAASKGFRSVVESLLGRQDVTTDAPDSKGETALMKAAENGHESVVEALLARPIPDGSEFVRFNDGSGFYRRAPLIEVDQQDNKGQTALMKAKAKGHAKIVEILKRAGARDRN
jgi:ankyrin repeat protein